jgi:HD superfamily phosphohydrolase
MYWQVYLHKTTVSAEKMLINLIQRAKKLAQGGRTFYVTEELAYFMAREVTVSDFKTDSGLLKKFLQLDDFDIWGAIKLWKNDSDYVLKNISSMFLTRNLFKITLVNEPYSPQEIAALRSKAQQKLQLPDEDVDYFFSTGTISNYGYVEKDRISILTKHGEVVDVASAADLPNIKVMSKMVEKHYVCVAKSLLLPH